MDSKKITIYTTPTCAFCHAAKEFFHEHNIDFVEHDVAKDEQRREEMIQKSGQLGVPVIDIDGQIITGFNRAEIAELLGISSN